MLTALVLALGFPAGILLMLVTMAALDPTSDRKPKRRPAREASFAPSQRPAHGAPSRAKWSR